MVHDLQTPDRALKRLPLPSDVSQPQIGARSGLFAPAGSGTLLKRESRSRRPDGARYNSGSWGPFGATRPYLISDLGSPASPHRTTGTSRGTSGGRELDCTPAGGSSLLFGPARRPMGPLERNARAGARHLLRPGRRSIPNPQGILDGSSQLLSKAEELDGSPLSGLTEAKRLQVGNAQVSPYGQSWARCKQQKGGFPRKSKNFLPAPTAQNPRNSLNSLSIMVF